MNILTDIHSHTYPASHDGKSSMEEMVDAAIKKTVSYYGISDHFDYDIEEMAFAQGIENKYSNGNENDYFQGARLLQEKHKDKITILVGAEFSYSNQKGIQERYLKTYQKYQPDFIINSVHSIDGMAFSRTSFAQNRQEVFGEYLKLVRQSLDALYPYDIVGHFEVIARYVPFDDKYINIMEFKNQVDDILKAIITKKKILEINTSVYNLPRICFPSKEILYRYYELGGRMVTFASDAHTPERIIEGRTKVVELLKDIGFDSFTIPIRGQYIQVCF